MEKEWITKEDVRAGIVQLMKAGKKLPFYRKIEDIRYNSEERPEEVARLCKEEALKQLAELTEQWYSIVVPDEEYRKTSKVMTKERWQLAIKETLKVEDYYRTLDFSLVAQGIDNADEILKEKAIEEARERQGEWRRSFADAFTDEDKYRNVILGKWTALRIKYCGGIFHYPYYCADVLPEAELDANRKLLLAEGRKMFPGIDEEVLKRNLILVGMQHVNREHCQKHCNGKNCYMKGYPLVLNFDGERFFVEHTDEPCQKRLRQIVQANA